MWQQLCHCTDPHTPSSASLGNNQKQSLSQFIPVGECGRILCPPNHLLYSWTLLLILAHLWNLPWKSPVRSGLQPQEHSGLKGAVYIYKSMCCSQLPPALLVPQWDPCDAGEEWRHKFPLSHPAGCCWRSLSAQSCIDTEQTPCLSRIRSYSADWQWIISWIMRHDLARVFSIMEEQ